MEKTKKPIWRNILILGVILVAAAWFTYQNRREAARVDALASLPPCRLAAEYMKWRMAFEEAQPSAESTGDDRFVDQSELFEKAVRQAPRDAQPVLLDELESLTTMDSAVWVRGGGDINAFVDVMLAECPDEVRELLEGSGE